MKNEATFFSMHYLFYPIGWPKVFFRQHDRLKSANLQLFSFVQRSEKHDVFSIQEDETAACTEAVNFSFRKPTHSVMSYVQKT